MAGLSVKDVRVGGWAAPCSPVAPWWSSTVERRQVAGLCCCKHPGTQGWGAREDGGGKRRGGITSKEAAKRASNANDAGLVVCSLVAVLIGLQTVGFAVGAGR